MIDDKLLQSIEETVAKLIACPTYEQTLKIFNAKELQQFLENYLYLDNHSYDEMIGRELDLANDYI